MTTIARNGHLPDPSALSRGDAHEFFCGPSPPDEGIAPLQSKPVTVVSARAIPTGADPRTDFVLGPLFTSLGAS